MSTTDAIAFLACVAVMALGTMALRRALLQRREAGRHWTVLGWVAILAGIGLAAVLSGAERGLALAGVAISLAAIAAVLLGFQRRPERVREREVSAAEPSERASRWWRGVVRVLLAGPLSGGAAIGVGLAVAVHAPLGEADRLVLGGSLVPLGWAAGMAWTLADDRIVRPGLILIAVGAAGFAFSAV